MNKIRLVQIIPTLQCGGAERMVVNLMTHLDPDRVDVRAIVLARTQGGTLERSLLERGFDVSYLDKEPAFDSRTFLRIRHVVRRFRPHLVHSHLCLHYVFPALSGYRWARHVTTLHLPGDTRYAQVMMPLTRLALRRGVVPIAVSGEVAAWVKRACGARDCFVIPNGIPIADYQHLPASRTHWRATHGLIDADVTFVCVARLEHQKNHSMLLNAFGRAFAGEPRAHLLLVGDGSCRKALELRARELRLDTQIRFLGQRADVPEILRAADVLVLASHNEGNPLAVLEGMAAGLPVVATAVGGVPELIVDQQSGLLVTPDDCGQFAASMRRLFDDAQLRRTMAACSAERALQAFSAQRMAHEHMDLYERIVGGSAPLVAGCRVRMAT
jgi:glycosyltransferase involved in cell wall biosynthesis